MSSGQHVFRAEKTWIADRDSSDANGDSAVLCGEDHALITGYETFDV